MALINSTAIPSGATFEIDQSLRFEDSRSSYLSRTPAADGNRKTWTLSYWIKRGGIADHKSHFGGSLSGSASVGVQIQFDGGTQQLIIVDYRAGYQVDWIAKSNAGFRDTSAWYHILIAVDTTQSTASNRVKLYANGELLTLATYTAPSQNFDTKFNQNSIQVIGAATDNLTPTNFYEGYMSEVNFLDGVVATPADFGETGTYGEWKPIAYSGSYGTNGFYLPFKQDYTVEGFSTVTYSGTGVAGTYTGGVGFQSDMTWVKSRTGAENHSLYDAVRGGGKTLYPNLTAEENSGNLLTFTTDGFTQNTTNNNDITAPSRYVAWNWDMGGSNATNTTGSIQSTVRANPTYGQSIVSYVGNTTAGATVGHGLSSAPEMMIIKNRDRAYDWIVWHDSLADDYHLRLNGTHAAINSSTRFNSTDPSSTVFTLGSQDDTNGVSGANDDLIAYCFHSVTGYSKFGTYEGDGSTSHAITTGFKPAFVLTKNVDSPSDPQSWFMFDNTRSPSNPIKKLLKPDSSNAEGTDSTGLVNFTDTGFTWLKGNDGINKSGDTFIYMAFADKREYAYWLDQSGNNNDWTSNNLTESDIMVDSPTNNFATWDALRAQRPTLWEGNLLTETSTNTISRSIDTNFRPVSGKWYVEVYMKVVGTGENTQVGIANDGFVAGNEFKGHNNGVSYAQNGQKGLNNSMSSYGATYTAGDIIGIAYDVDNSNVTFYKNGASQGAITSGWDGSNGRVVVATNSSSATGQRYAINFGQDSSFAGLKVAQSNQDSNGIGDFYYAPPTGFLALCTKNLPDVAVIPSEHFNTVLYTGNGTTGQSITGVGFQSDFSWFKARAATTGSSHRLYDAVRGVTHHLRSNSTAGETTDTELTSFDADGFTIDDDGNGSINDNNIAYVAWNWKANGSGSSNSDGSITSTVSANVDAGFSVISYTGAGASSAGSTVGHGLSAKPDLIIIKIRPDNYTGKVYNSISGAEKYFDWASTAVLGDYTQHWNDTEPTSSVFTLGSDITIGGYPVRDFIAWCWHSVDGYSKVGSYTGNGNADGPFVQCGFKPAWIMVKRTDAVAHWQIHDTKRSVYNPSGIGLLANTSDSDGISAVYDMDITSNGFKLRATHAGQNASGGTYIFLAFAETPFKYSNAR